mgnify:FL=1
MNLKDNDIILRPLIKDDSRRLSELCNNKKIWDNLRDFIPFPYTENDALNFIEMCQSEEPQVTFGIEYKNELVGVIGLIPQKDIYRLSAEIGYWIGEDYWNKGIATRSTSLIVDYAFNKLGLIRLFTGVFDFNTASQRVLEKAGFKQEGIFKKSVIKNDIIHDEYRYAITKN